MKKNNFFDSLAKGGDKNKSNSTNNTVIYTRVSSKDQADNNMSLETQMKACLKHAEKNNLIVKKTFGGTYESAKTDERPNFKQLLEYVRNSKNEISYILIYSYDRFSRTGLKSAQIIAELSEIGIDVISVTQPVDTSSPSGTLQQNILMIFNHFDNQLRRAKTIAGMKDKLERGDWTTKLTVGYSKDKNTGHIYVNNEGQLVKEGFELFVQGFTISQIVNLIGAKGLRLRKQRWNNILKNPFYCGMISHKLLEGKVIKGNHEPLISKELFQQVHETRTGGRRINSIKAGRNKHSLKGFVYCQRCGTPMTGYEQKGYEYYKCNKKACCNHSSGKKMDESFQEFLKKFELNSKYVEVIDTFLQAEFDYRNEKVAINKKTVESSIASTKQKLNQLDKKFLYSDSVNEDLYNSERTRLTNELSMLVETNDKLSFQLSNSQEFIDAGIEISSHISEIWESGDYELRIKLQNLAFPEGASYDKTTDNYRTPKINRLFGVILSLSSEIEEKRKGTVATKANMSPLVPGVGLEPTRPEGHEILSLACLPIPPSRLSSLYPLASGEGEDATPKGEQYIW
jgi:site-specific DNA recombinase